jgi:endonuclease/exonuclease/phosphatase (EEP) superfamily protein YafD
MIVRIILASAILAGAAVTLLGMLAPIYPPADFINHFRPFIVGAASALLVAAVGIGEPRIIRVCAVLVALNAALLALPLLWSAEPAERRAAGQALASAGHRDLKLVTFNTLFGDPAPVARFLLHQDADIVVLQEIAARQATALAALLRERYPHSHACRPQDRCAAAIFAKQAWIAAGQEEWTRDSPEMIWAQFDDADIGRLRVIGVHLALPLRPDTQTRHVERLIAHRASIPGPILIAGDFNMTPWSYRLQRLLASTGLRRHATFLRSWPTDRQFRLPAPAFLIDHVLTTPDIASVSIRTGPEVGSDHLPVIARVRLPPA